MAIEVRNLQCWVVRHGPRPAAQWRWSGVGGEGRGGDGGDSGGGSNTWHWGGSSCSGDREMAVEEVMVEMMEVVTVELSPCWLPVEIGAGSSSWLVGILLTCCILRGSAWDAILSKYFGVAMFGFISSNQMQVYLDNLNTPLQFCPVYFGQFYKTGWAHLCLF